MAQTAERTRARILDAAYGLFYRSGFGRVGVDEIANAARVTKRTLYYHFKSKDELLAAVLESQHTLAMARVYKDDARYRNRSAEGIISTRYSELVKWSRTPHWTGAGFTRLAMELADLPGHPARTIARRHKAAVEAWWAGILKGAGVASPEARARDMTVLMEGAIAMILLSGDRTYADTAANAAIQLVKSPRGSGRARRRSPRGAKRRPRVSWS
jgi:AcrR family transcriptional regulator